MRKRRSIKSAEGPRRAWASLPAGLVLAGGIFFSSPAGLFAQDKGLSADRVDRVERAQVQQVEAVKADTEVWTPAKIMLNLDARCPVVLTLGYFGAFATQDKDPAKAAALQSKFAELQKTVEPIAEELKQMAVRTPFIGRKFPVALNPRLEALSGVLYGEVLKLYGDSGLAELKQYVAVSTQGAVVDRVN